MGRSLRRASSLPDRRASAISASVTTPRQAGFSMPAEWEPHEATWVAWPSHEDLWQENLGPAREAFARLVAAIAEGERAEVLVPDAEQERLARAALPAENVRYHRVPFGDIWLRDTAPHLPARRRRSGSRPRCASGSTAGAASTCWSTTTEVAERIAGIAGGEAATGASPRRPACWRAARWTWTGEGSVLTTRQCLLNPNRNGAVDEKTVEGWLRDALGVERVLWLGDGLLNDHTDGHVDTVVRFVRPGRGGGDGGAGPRAIRTARCCGALIREAGGARARGRAHPLARARRSTRRAA